MDIFVSPLATVLAKERNQFLLMYAILPALRIHIFFFPDPDPAFQLYLDPDPGLKRTKFSLNRYLTISNNNMYILDLQTFFSDPDPHGTKMLAFIKKNYNFSNKIFFKFPYLLN